MDIIPSYELFDIILGWGIQVEALESFEMRKQIKVILEGTLGLY